jgi:hypothetical protein
MRYVPVAWQRPGWNIHISSDISALWAERHSSPCLYSSLYLYNQVKWEVKWEIKLYHSPKDSYAETYMHVYIHFHKERRRVLTRYFISCSVIGECSL